MKHFPSPLLALSKTFAKAPFVPRSALSTDPLSSHPIMKHAVKSVGQHIKLVLKLGAGFFADAYDLFVIDIVLSILQEQAIDDDHGMGFDATSTKSLVAASTSIGAVIGMVLFGLIGDIIGRRMGVLITGTLVAVGSLLSACAIRSDVVSLCTQLTIYRTLLGIGIGGEYPLSATMASEGAEANVRGRVVAGVFSMQGVGMLFSSLLAYILIKIGAPLEFTWRFLLAFGAVPALVALWFRLRMKEKKRTVVITDDPSTGRRSYRGILKQYLVPLIATSLAWFLLDVTFYGTGEFKHSVSEALFPASTQATISSSDKVAQDALFGIIISAIALPGYICSCIFIDRIGLWNLQVGGFIAMTLVYIAMAMAIQIGVPDHLNGINLCIFGLTFFFTNFGPNTTTFIIPSEIYPSSVRATCHGISAAFGKIGAIVGAAGFPPTIHHVGLFGVMYICAGIAFAGLLTTIGLLDKNLLAKAALEPRESNDSISDTTPESPCKIHSNSSTYTTTSAVV
jgi:MFS transporter, PHS family, inorganic phosphate transporter